MRCLRQTLPCFINIKSLVLAFILFIPFITEAQQQSLKKQSTLSISDTIRNLNVGDIVPDIFIEKIINDDKSSAHTSDYKDDLLILDFWTTGCTACIAAFPKMDSLQREFGDKIKILAVTYEAENHVKTFFKNNKYAKATMLPSVVEDKILNKWFKHWAIPHEVWIYKGKIIALTNDEYVTAKNIRYVLDGHLPRWPIKNDFQEIDLSKPLVSKDHAGKTISYVAIMPFKEGVHDKKIISTLDSATRTRRNYFLNLTILQAYKILWAYVVHLPLLSASPNRLILNVKDRSKYIYDQALGTKEEWNRQNQFCYESVTPDRGGDLKEQYQLMIGDLNRLLGLDARWEKRLRKCLVLTRTSTKDKIKSKGGESFSALDKKVKQFRNTPLVNLVYTLNNYEKNPPVFDDSGYENPVDLDLEISSFTDIQSVRKALQRYDLDLKEEGRELDMFVLREK